MIVDGNTPIDSDQQVTMEEILVRDQRTTWHRVIDQHCATPNCQTNLASNGTTAKLCKSVVNANTRHATEIATGIESEDREERHKCDSCYVPASYDDRGIRAPVIRHPHQSTWLRYGCFLVTFLIISVHCAPTMNYSDSRLMNSPMKWVNPCGLTEQDTGGDTDVEVLSDSVLVNQIRLASKYALAYTEVFRDSYAKQIFQVEFPHLHMMFLGHRYDWLPNIPKALGEKLSVEYLKSLNLDTVLIDIYEMLQIFAVGIEQVVWDQQIPMYNPKFKAEFERMENNLRAVLCELQVALAERQTDHRPDVTRLIMSRELRDLSNDTFRNLRDWLIFRDYMNCLEYVVQVMDYLHEHHAQS